MGTMSINEVPNSAGSVIEGIQPQSGGTSGPTHCPSMAISAHCLGIAVAFGISGVMFLLADRRVITWFSFSQSYGRMGVACIMLSILIILGFAGSLVVLALAGKRRWHTSLFLTHAEIADDPRNRLRIGYGLMLGGVVLGPLLLIPAMISAHRLLLGTRSRSCSWYDERRALTALLTGYVLVPLWVWYAPAILRGSLLHIW